jgi:hypothetical protein
VCDEECTYAEGVKAYLHAYILTYLYAYTKRHDNA